MKTKDGYVQGYNAQAVATEDQIVVAAEVTDEHNDHAQLHPMIAATNRSLADAGIDGRPEQLLGDAGYCSEENLAGLTDEGPDCFIATRNTRRNPQPRHGRRGPLPANATLVDKMDRKVSKKAGRAIYQKRQHIIEPVFGQTKNARGARGFMRRGKRVETAAGHPQPAQALPPDPDRPHLDPLGTPDPGRSHLLSGPDQARPLPQARPRA